MVKSVGDGGAEDVEVEEEEMEDGEEVDEVVEDKVEEDTDSGRTTSMRKTTEVGEEEEVVEEEEGDEEDKPITTTPTLFAIVARDTVIQLDCALPQPLCPPPLLQRPSHYHPGTHCLTALPPFTVLLVLRLAHKGWSPEWGGRLARELVPPPFSPAQHVLDFILFPVVTNPPIYRTLSLRMRILLRRGELLFLLLVDFPCMTRVMFELAEVRFLTFKVLREVESI